MKKRIKDPFVCAVWRFALPLLLCLACLLSSCALRGGSSSDKPEYLDPEGLSDEELQRQMEELLQPVDADAYFEEMGNVKGKIGAQDAPAVLSERELVTDLQTRGFDPAAVYTEYDMDGRYSQAAPVSAASGERHPVYHLIYLDAEGRYWSISVINKSAYAILLSEESIPVIAAESATIAGYDSATNTFYEYVPNTATATVKTVPTLSASALDNIRL